MSKKGLVKLEPREYVDINQVLAFEFHDLEEDELIDMANSCLDVRNSLILLGNGLIDVVMGPIETSEGRFIYMR